MTSVSSTCCSSSLQRSIPAFATAFSKMSASPPRSPPAGFAPLDAASSPSARPGPPVCRFLPAARGELSAPAARFVPRSPVEGLAAAGGMLSVAVTATDNCHSWQNKLAGKDLNSNKSSVHRLVQQRALLVPLPAVELVPLPAVELPGGGPPGNSHELARTWCAQRRCRWPRCERASSARVAGWSRRTRGSPTRR